MEIPVSGLEVVRSRKVVNHEKQTVTRLKPGVLGYVLSVNLETHRVTCVTRAGVVTSLAILQDEFADDSVYVRWGGEGDVPEYVANIVRDEQLPDMKTREPVVSTLCNQHGHFLPLTDETIPAEQFELTCVCGRLTVLAAALRTIWED